MTLTSWRRTVPVAREFRVSHTGVTTVEVLTLQATGRDTTGVGVVAVGPWRPVDPDEVERCARRLVEQVLAGPSAPGPILVDRLRRAVRPWWTDAPAACQLAEMCVLDSACHASGRPLWQFLGLPRPPVRLDLFRTLSLGAAPPTSSCRSLLKVKLGGATDAAVLDALVRSGHRHRSVLLDVNRGWDRDDVTALLPHLRALQPMALEDPVRDRALLPVVREALPDVPILLDEGVDSVQAVDAAAAVADGVNLKVAKFGGLLPTLDAAERASRAGCRVMLGCFLEPPAAIGYAATMAGLTEWQDLDGHTWLEHGWPDDRLAIDSDMVGPPRLVRGASG